jgi:hypothetical protein
VKSVELQFRDHEGRVRAAATIHTRQQLHIRLPLLLGRTAVVELHAAGGPPSAPLFRVFRWAWSAAPENSKVLTGAKPVPDAPAAFLHTNTCGDFTLMAREHWFDLRGYPEFDMYSFHIDSLLCYAAHHGGATEEMLSDPLRIYHIEHGKGSGWTPEGESKLFGRLQDRGLPWLEYSELVGWIDQMRRLNCPLIFNRESWGLADLDLPETTLSVKTVAAGGRT